MRRILLALAVVCALASSAHAGRAQCTLDQKGEFSNGSSYYILGDGVYVNFDLWLNDTESKWVSNGDRNDSNPKPVLGYCYTRYQCPPFGFCEVMEYSCLAAPISGLVKFGFGNFMFSADGFDIDCSAESDKGKDGTVQTGTTPFGNSRGLKYQLWYVYDACRLKIQGSGIDVGGNGWHQGGHSALRIRDTQNPYGCSQGGPGGGKG